MQIWIFIYTFIVFHIGMAWMSFLTPEFEPVKIKYNELDQYYIDCRSWHNGAGHVIIESDGTYSLTCADGHAPSAPEHPTKKPIPTIRAN